MDSQNFALNKKFCGKIFEVIDNPQNYLPHVRSTQRQDVQLICVLVTDSRTLHAFTPMHHWKDTPELKRT